ncbi:MAG: VOC family protein [Candidatus Poribacteria bacterium]|nr:VOC family protein [Candidatus Poribacteria bacterium]
MIHLKAVDFFVYSVSDMGKARAFYENVLNLQPIGEPGESWTEYDIGGRTLALRKVRAGEDEPPGGAIAVAVDDVADAVDALKAEGVVIPYPVGDFPSCHTAIALDPDNNPILIHRRKDGTVG